MEDLESGIADSESVQSEGQSRQTTCCDAQLSPMLSVRAPNIGQQQQPPSSSAGPEGEEAQEGDETCNVLAGGAGDRRCIPQKHRRNGSWCHELDGEHGSGPRKRVRKEKPEDPDGLDSLQWIHPSGKHRALFVRYILQRMVFEDAPSYIETHARSLAQTCGDWSRDTLFSAFSAAYPLAKRCRSRYYMNNG